ncbi:MAG: SRPBCC family protein [Myxococcota bacterium]|nr:SRPBCC family protein [Myxococcota bacterium]
MPPHAHLLSRGDMRIEADALIEHPREAVFRAYRDDLPRLAEAMPRIRRIEVESRRELGPIVEIVNVWHGSGQIPAVAEKILPPVLTWHDYARWDESTWTATWRLRSHVFPEAISCEGENRFVDLGDGRTRVEVLGEIRVDLGKVRMVPELLASSVSSVVERFFVRQITPNLISVSDALSDLLDAAA